MVPYVKGDGSEGFLRGRSSYRERVTTGDIPRGRASAQGSVKIPEAEKIVITVITDNLTDALRPDYKIAKRHSAISTSPLEGILHAEHGLAYHVETTVDGQTHSFLFDFATDAYGVRKNIELLKIDVRNLEAMATLTTRRP
jgi:hypothetical protein